MSTLPLITHPQASSVFAWRKGETITAARFLVDVAALARLLPPGRHMLNACADRYRFAVGVGAALVSGKICLLPPTQAPEMIRQMQQFAPDAFCLTDAADCPVALPQLRYPDAPTQPEPAPHAGYVVPQIAATQLVAYVFTSGSTGAPVPHPKAWGALVANVRAGAQLCQLDDGRAHAIIGTVPPQHMYGFESTVLNVMQSANAMVAGSSFYPADICQAIESVPHPRALVSTPVHLKSVLATELPLPSVDLIVCATAPLSTTLAQEIEARFAAPLLEIYGSTETGQIAMRRSARTAEWQLFANLCLEQRDGVTWVYGGHVERPTPMHDVIEHVGDKRFLLHGRMADMINIAGKRNSLAYLNLQLAAIPGVVDGAFYMPDETIDGVTRLWGFVVAPTLSVPAVLAALRERVDPVFLPRPLVKVASLPRNATGKLPREALRALAAVQMAAAGERRMNGRVRLPIADNHPAYAGHFPGAPILPGVVLLDEALVAIGNALGQNLSACQIASVKFLSPVQPGDCVDVQFEVQASGTISFDLLAKDRKLACGSLRPAAAG